MESANLGHLHQLQEQVGGSSSLAVPSINGVGSNNSWRQNLLLSGCNFNSNFNGVLSNPRDHLRQNTDDILVHPSLNSSMLQDLGFQWANSAENYPSHPSNNLQLPKIKEELSDTFPKFNDPSTTEELHSPSTSYLKQEQQYLQDLDEKLLLRNFFSECQLDGFHPSGGDFYSTHQSSTGFGTLAAVSGRGNYSRILPSANIASLNTPVSLSPSSMGMNLQALDLLNSTKAGANFSQPFLNNFGSFKGLPFALDNLQESSHGPSTSCQKMSFVNGAVETKRSGLGVSEPKGTQALPKKPRFESRPLPAFKVRKEKLGDRIAALQQLVAPFGKTDTASVLLEAIGYIKFLQDQVETLSVPYMKNNASRVSKTGSSDEESKEEPKRDLRSRGLCLVPLSCTSYVTNDNGSVWSPPNYSGGT